LKRRKTTVLALLFLVLLLLLLRVALGISSDDHPKTKFCFVVDNEKRMVLYVEETRISWMPIPIWIVAVSEEMTTTTRLPSLPNFEGEDVRFETTLRESTERQSSSSSLATRSVIFLLQLSLVMLDVKEGSV
jgi:hypothetical protein